jgi:hypothetical protein
MNIIRCPQQALSADYGDIILNGLPQAGQIIGAGNDGGDFGFFISVEDASVGFEVTCNNEVILTETYSPDKAGFIHIRDMASLAYMYIRENNLSENADSNAGAITFNLKFEEKIKDSSSKEIYVKSTETANTTIFLCYPETAGTLTINHIQSIPLTRCFKKTVALGQQEYISFYGTGGTIKLLVVYTGTTHDLSAEFNFANLPAAPDNIYRLDVSPATVAQLAGIDPSLLVQYILYKQKNYAVQYTFNPYIRPGKTFVFLNAFGAQETLTCYGDSESEEKWTREFGKINRRRQLISREPDKTHTVNTGYLTREQTAIAEDLLNSGQVALIDEYGWYPVVITEEKFETKSRVDELIDVQFKYRLASGNQLQHRFHPFRYRIFDSTFDNTYN